MKSKILLSFVVLVLGGLNLYFNSPPDASLDAILSNIEALAQNEGTTSPNMKLERNNVSLCKVCVSGGSGCAVSAQCCLSWGNCSW